MLRSGMRFWKKNEIDIADFLESLDAEEAAVVFRMLKKEMAAEVFSNLSADTQKVIVDSITDQEIVGIIEDLYVDDAVDDAGGVACQRSEAHPEKRKAGDKESHQPLSQIRGELRREAS